jgi:hypothetical protein
MCKPEQIIPAWVEHHGFQTPRHLAWRTGRFRLAGFARYLTSTSQTPPQFRFVHFDVADKQHNPGGGYRYV